MMIQTKKNPVNAADPSQTACSRWRTCALSNVPLQAPVVACELGYLYNKEPLIKHLGDKDRVNHTDHFAFSHVRRLKDVILCNFSWDVTKRTSNDHVDDVRHVFICPTTHKQANGRYPFLLMRNCGCVLAKRAFVEVKDSTQCPNCNSPLRGSIEQESILLNPTQVELDEMRERLEIKRMPLKRERHAIDGKEKKEEKEVSSRKRKQHAPDQPHAAKKRPGPSINTQYQSSINTQNLANPVLQGLWLSSEEQKRIPGLTSTKIPTALNLL